LTLFRKASITALASPVRQLEPEEDSIPSMSTLVITAR